MRPQPKRRDIKVNKRIPSFMPIIAQEKGNGKANKNERENLLASVKISRRY